MDDLNFNVDDIINDVNAKIKSAEKNEADEESVEAEPIADTENSSEPLESRRTGNHRSLRGAETLRITG